MLFYNPVRTVLPALATQESEFLRNTSFSYVCMGYLEVNCDAGTFSIQIYALSLRWKANVRRSGN
jgi:hypothetical protein